jgi:signal peptide peptidase SppA
MSNAASALQEAGTSLLSRPRSGLVRGPVGELGIRSSAGGKKRRTLAGPMVPFNEWIEIDSIIEGHFMEQFVPGSVDKTFSEGRERMRCILHHGKEITGRLVIGKIIDLHTDEVAGYYEVELFEGLPHLLMEGLESGEYGTSILYEVVKPDASYRPGVSTHNPKGLDELRVLEAKIIEFGPTPFAHYPGTTAGLRSLTDDALLSQLADDPERLEKLMERGRITIPVGEPEEPTVTRRYARACEFAQASVWTMHPGALATIIQIIGERKQGYRPSAEEISERLGARERADAAEPATSPVRVIEISGPIVPHAGMFVDVSTPGRAIEDLQGEFRDAMSSEDVKAVLFNVDSPGGSVDLVPEFAAEIRDARGTKPIWAIANTFAASGGYYLASQADELVVTPSGEVGSVGAYAIHTDISELQAKAGLRTTLISAGDYKVEGNPFEPLSAEAEQEIQDKIDAVYTLFVKDVAKGRDVTVKTVEADFGQGRMVLAGKAVERGMADSVATFDQTMTRLTKLVGSASTERAASLPEPEPVEATTHRSRSTRPGKDYLEREKPKWQL